MSTNNAKKRAAEEAVTDKRPRKRANAHVRTVDIRERMREHLEVKALPCCP